MIDIPRLDPLPGYNFRVTLIDTSGFLGGAVGAAVGLLTGGFTECKGLESTLETEDYLEGGVNDRVHRFPTRMAYSNITLIRGVGLGEDLWNWHQEYIDGKGKRRDGLIVLQDNLGIPIKIWSWARGLPVKWIGPPFDAQSSAVSIETLEIAHEKLELVVSPGKLLSDISPF